MGGELLMPGTSTDEVLGPKLSACGAFDRDRIEERLDAIGLSSADHKCRTLIDEMPDPQANRKRGCGRLGAGFACHVLRFARLG